MKKSTIILSTTLFFAGACANQYASRQTKRTSNELADNMATPTQEGQEGIAQADEKPDKTEETNAASEPAGKMATPEQEGIAQADEKPDKPKEISAPSDIKARILSKNEINQLLTKEIKKTFGIQYPIWRVYAYSDNLGEHRIVLTESASSRNIKAFFFRLENELLIKENEMSDFVRPDEGSIWFWTRYCSFSDIDGDGLVEPIIVYGSNDSGSDPRRVSTFEEYRVNILVYYKGEKYAQRHTDGVSDYMRSTQIDEKFYVLPQAIQEHVKSTINAMEKNGHIVSWETK